MTVDLRQVSFLPASHLRGSIDSRPAEIIVMHSMECPPTAGRAVNQAKSLASPSGGPYFAHYYTDPANILRVAELGRTVPHVGGGNEVRGRWTLGVEQAGNSADLKDSAGHVYRTAMTRQEWIDAGTLKTAGPLVAALVAAGHGAARWLSVADLGKPGARGITGHNEMRQAFGGTSHTDPGEAYPRDLLLAYCTDPNPHPEDDDMAPPVLMQAGPPGKKSGPVFLVYGSGLAVPMHEPADIDAAKFFGAVDHIQADGTALLGLAGVAQPAS